MKYSIKRNKNLSSMETAMQKWNDELKRRIAIINSEEDGFISECMLNNLFVDEKQYLEMEKQQIGNAILEELKEWGAPYLFEESSMNSWAEKRMKIIAETYGSKGSDKEEQKKLITEIMNDDAKDGLYNEINWGGVVQHIPNMCNCHQSNCHLINGKYICASCNKTLNVETQPITSFQKEINNVEKKAMDLYGVDIDDYDGKFEEYDRNIPIREAFVKGYNKCLEDNSQTEISDPMQYLHREILDPQIKKDIDAELGKQLVSSLTEISDEDIEKMYSEEDMINYAVWFTIEISSISGRNRTSKELLDEWYREQLKKKQ